MTSRSPMPRPGMLPPALKGSTTGAEKVLPLSEEVLVGPLVGVRADDQVQLVRVHGIGGDRLDAGPVPVVRGHPVEQRDPPAVRRIPAVRRAHVGAGVDEVLLLGAEDDARDVPAAHDLHVLPGVRLRRRAGGGQGHEAQAGGGGAQRREPHAGPSRFTRHVLVLGQGLAPAALRRAARARERALRAQVQKDRRRVESQPRNVSHCDYTGRRLPRGSREAVFTLTTMVGHHSTVGWGRQRPSPPRARSAGNAGRFVGRIIPGAAAPRSRSGRGRTSEVASSRFVTLPSASHSSCDDAQ